VNSEPSTHNIRLVLVVFTICKKLGAEKAAVLNNNSDNMVVVNFIYSQSSPLVR